MSSDTTRDKQPVLIIGAGMGGLLLAQALKKLDIPYLLFERDRNIDWRSQGWGLTVQAWSTPKFRGLVPDAVASELPSTLVDPVHAANQTDLLFLDTSTGEVMAQLSFPGRMRLNRNQTRRLLLTGAGGVEVHWGKKIVSYSATERGGVKAKFEDGTEYEGGMLIGVDGAHSVVRSALCPGKAALNVLPIGYLVVLLDLTHEQIAPMLAVDPVMFLGGCSDCSCIFFAVLSTPEVNGTAVLPPSEHRWHVQVNVSWPKRDGDLGVPEGQEERVRLLQEKMVNVWSPIKDAVMKGLTEDKVPVDTLEIADWVTSQDPWDNLDGRVTMAGDAAHKMTMFRGEGFNNMVLDAYNLVEAIQQIYSTPADVRDFVEKRKRLIGEYEQELRERGESVVLASREQCLMVHDWEKYRKWAQETKQWHWAHEKQSA